MEASILTSTKLVCGLTEAETAFDFDILTGINAAFANLKQFGVGPAAGFVVEDSQAEWTDFVDANVDISHVKNYIFLKTRVMFDPPPLSFHLDAMNNQIKEMEFRIQTDREVAVYEEGQT